MKKWICLLLCALLLTGCGAAQEDETAQTPTISIYTPDAPVAPETEPADAEAILAQRREVVEQHMRYMSTVRWTVDEDVSYVYASNGDTSTTIELKTGRIYQGIPYTHGCGSAYSWLSYATGQDENGVYKLSGMHNAVLNGVARNGVGNCSRVGNDCADCVYWAWAQVSNTISFENTNHMTPVFGCIPVGDYDWDGTIMFSSTKNVLDANGQQRMFEAYAQLQKGDAMVRIVDSGGGHAVMIVGVHVERNAEGIDGDASYVTVLEQTGGNEKKEKKYFDEELGQDVYLCEIVDKNWSFNTIYEKGYLPITCQELIDPSPLPEPTVEDPTAEPTVDTMFESTITSNYRIASVTVTVSDAQDRPVQQATCNSLELEFFSFKLNRFLSDAQQDLLVGEIDLSALEPGTYTCTFDCRLSTGKVIRFRDFTVTL